MIAHGEFDNQKLVTELMSVPVGEKNRKYQDDLTDALRYVVKLIPWDFPKISPHLKMDEEVKDEVPKQEWSAQEYQAWEIRQRRGEMSDEQKDEWHNFSQEIDAWNEAYGN